MIIESSLDEVKRRESAMKIIRSKLGSKGRKAIYDLTGLAGGFPLLDGDMALLETYAGPAVFDDEIQRLGREHLGGEKILALNRTSSGILAATLALVQEGDEIVHYLPKSPAHPSIPRSAELVGATYREFEDINQFKVGEKTALVFITGSTMDHQVIDENNFRKVVELAHEHGVPVFVDDASGARLRTVIYKQPRAMDMGADLAVTSTDKLMDGPRGGLMAGKEDIIDRVKSKALQFGLEAQPPLVVGMARALENFKPERIVEAFHTKDEIYTALKEDIPSIMETPTGFMLKPEGFMAELDANGVETCLSQNDLAFVFARLLLEKHGIITIPAVGMPGASATVRIDLASKDASRIERQKLIDAFKRTLHELVSIASDEGACRAVLGTSQDVQKKN
jgi:L-seryl-tRNA(Ser) seleniumtransferase